MKLNQISALFGLTVAAVKIYADIKKHKTHESHNQLCDCLGYCYVCIADAAKP